MISVNSKIKRQRIFNNSMSQQERLIASSSVDLTTECWNWNLRLDHDGYGRISYNSCSMKASKVSYLEFIGSIPEGLCVCHKCDNRRCINPHHLFLGTHKDNAIDKMNKGRFRGNNKLTRNQVKEIKNLCMDRKSTYREIGERFGVTGETISLICRNVTNIDNFDEFKD